MLGGWVGKRGSLASVGSLVALAFACGSRINAEHSAPDAEGNSAGERSGTTGPSRDGHSSSGGASVIGGSTAAVDDELPLSSCGSGPGPGDQGIGGSLPYCGGCAGPLFVVTCSRHAIVNDSWEDPDAACAGAQDQVSGLGGAPMEAAAGAPALASGGASSDGSSGTADACDSWVDPPATEFDDGACIAVQDDDFGGTCIVGDECCVIIDRSYCGI